MSSMRKLERDHVAADLASVEALIADLGDEDVVMRLSLDARREALARRLATMEDLHEETASAAIFFGGRPVVGARGIESEFGAKAVATFQDLVAKQFAYETGGLGLRGVVPNKALTRLHITNVVRGSFGFLMEELADQQPLFDSNLKNAVEHASRLISSFGEEDDEHFEAAIEDVDERVLATAREFFALMRQDGATFRLLSGDTDREFDSYAVERAAERARVTAIEDTNERLVGVLAGILPDGHLFEFRTNGPRGVIRGKVDRTIPAEELVTLNRDWLEQPCVAEVVVRKVRKEGELVRETFTLRAITPPALA